MKFGSLFSGIGGFDLGFERAGLECAWQVEIDKDCQRVLKRAWPNVQRFDDVTTTKAMCKVSTDEAVDGVSQAAERPTGAAFVVQDVLQRLCAGDSKAELQSRAKTPLADDDEIRNNTRRSGQDDSGAGRLMRDLPKGDGSPMSGSLPRDGNGSRGSLPSLQHQTGNGGESGIPESGVGVLEPVDIICAGFPCQDLSVAGKRAGLEGSRSGLFYEVIRIIGEMRAATNGRSPAFLVLENVPGIFSSNGGRDFAVVLRQIAKSGALDIAWTVLDAQWFGVAQRRRRLFLVADFRGERCAEILFESESVSRNPPTRREAGAGVASAVTTGTGKSSGPRNGNGDPLNLHIARPLAFSQTMNHYDESQQTYIAVAAPITASYGKQLDNSDRNGGPPNLIAFSSKDHGADAGEIAPTMRAQNFKDSHMNGGSQAAIAFSAGQGSRARSLAESEEHTPPLKAHASGLNQIPSVSGHFGVRRLTPTECERLQGFPDGWTAIDHEGKVISDSARYRMLGNAVEVDCAEWIGKRIQLVSQ